MTEQEYYRADNPDRILESPLFSALGRFSNRKARLFAVACVIQRWPRIDRDVLRNAVSVAERYADGLADAEEMIAAGERIAQVVPPGFAAAILRPSCNSATSNKAIASFRGFLFLDAFLLARETHQRVATASPINSAYVRTNKRQAEILRDIMGNPFRVGKDPVITRDVTALAHAAYEQRRYEMTCPACSGEGCSGNIGSEDDPSERCDGGGCWLIDNAFLDPFRLNLLADALEDAGNPGPLNCDTCKGSGVLCRTQGPQSPDDYVQCADCALVRHLRSKGPHFRGMWSLDRVLGKE